MADDGRSAPPEQVPLPAPRLPTARERALLDALVAPQRMPALTAQVEQARIVAVCSCGCPSIALRSDAPAVDTDVRSIAATALAPDGRTLEVTLHLVLGRLEELEIWAATWGGDPRSELPDPATLRHG